jgi:hypothetical protein
MKTAVLLITAIIVPGGLLILALAWLGQLLARRRAKGPAKPVLSGPLIP